MFMQGKGGFSAFPSGPRGTPKATCGDTQLLIYQRWRAPTTTSFFKESGVSAFMVILHWMTSASDMDYVQVRISCNLSSSKNNLPFDFNTRFYSLTMWMSSLIVYLFITRGKCLHLWRFEDLWIYARPDWQLQLATTQRTNRINRHWTNKWPHIWNYDWSVWNHIEPLNLVTFRHALSL